ncbi:MAG: NRDE family protein [Tenacibaculum sp.]
MCTVSYLPLGENNFMLTFNRDEDPKRDTIVPKEYVEEGVRLRYPKDKLAGGTWIGISDKSRLVCLLNGAFDKHMRKPPYKISRGLVVKHMLKADSVFSEIKAYDFANIEPFTLIIADWKTELKLFELVWNGTQKHFRKLSQEARIWSSSTLYNEKERELRRNWFIDWLKKHTPLKSNNQLIESIIAFHRDEKKGKPAI